MLVQTIVESFVDLVFSQIADQIDLGDKLRKWIKREPAKLAFKKALYRVYPAFVREYPEQVASLFDQSFFSKEAASEIGKLLVRHYSPDPVVLVKLWRCSITGKTDLRDGDEKFIEASAQWINWLEEELKSEEVLRPFFDSKALESLPNLEEKVDSLVRSLNYGLEGALKQNEQYGGIVEEIRKLSDRIVEEKNADKTANFYFSGEFNSLFDLYIPPQPIFDRVHVNEFVGRQWLTDQVDEFLNTNKKGVLLLVGNAGVGKTAFLANLVKQRGYIHVFGGQASGEGNVSRVLQTLGVQLVTRYQIQNYIDRNSLPQIAVFPDFLERLLQMAKEKCCAGEKIIIVCDALDEGGVASNGNVFGLPSFLPDGVYLILSQRPVNISLNIDAPLQTVRIDANSKENHKDIQDFLLAQAKKPSIFAQLQAMHYSVEEFVEKLAEKSEGVMMYLRYVIEEIASGSRHPLYLEGLPNGLAGYYAGYWDSWRQGKKGDGVSAWKKIYCPLLGMLGAIKEPVSLQELALWGGMDEEIVEQLLLQDWRAFITCQEEKNSKVLIYPYHASFQDFIRGEVINDKLSVTHQNLILELQKQTTKAHILIVEFLKQKCGGDWIILVDEGYPSRHLATHLAQSGEIETLINLLTHSDKWAKRKYAKDGHYESYRLDLLVLLNLLTRKQDLEFIIRTTLCLSSIISLSSNIPTSIIAQSVELCVLSPEQGMIFARQKQDILSRIEAILAIYEILLPDQRKNFNSFAYFEIISYLQSLKNYPVNTESFLKLKNFLSTDQQEQVMKESLKAARGIQDEGERARFLGVLGAHLPIELMKKALEEACGIHDEVWRESVLVDLWAHLPAELMRDALEATHAIKDEKRQARLLWKLGAHLQAEQQEQVIKEALEMACGIQDEDEQAHVLGKLGTNLSAEHQKQVMKNALEAAHVIEDEGRRSRVLGELGAYLPAELMKETLGATHSIQDEGWIARVLGELWANLPAERRDQVMKEALEVARGIRDGGDWQLLLSGLENDNVLIMENIIKQLVVIFSTERIDSQVVFREFAKRWCHFIWDEPDEEIDFLKKILWNSANYSRHVLLDRICDFIPVISSVGGENAICETVQAIRDTAEWWP